jgi:hypothetical protein
MTFTHTRAEMAHALGLSETRLQQFTALGIAKRNGGLYDPLETAFAYIAYLRRDEEAKAARTRQVNAKALQIEQRVRREQRRMFTILELKQMTVMIYDMAVEFVDAESSRVHSEHLKSHTEHNARILTGKFYDELRRIPDTWGAGVIQFCKDIERNVLPNDERVDDVIAKIIREIEAAYAADQKKLARPKPTP